MNKTAAIVGVCFFVMICAFMCAMPYMVGPDAIKLPSEREVVAPLISTSMIKVDLIATPTSEIDNEWIREYTNLRLRWAQTYFIVNGTVEFKDDRYYIKCKGLSEDKYYLLRMKGYADRVDVKLTDVHLSNYIGDTDLRDHKILKAMIKESKPIKS